MEKLIAELIRLYLAPEAATREALAQHLAGQQTLAIKLTTADKLVRSLAIQFRKMAGGGEGHWTRLCEVANALQAELGLPAPAVSIDGANAFYLWLSFEAPVSAGQAKEFLDLLRKAYFPEIELAPDAATAPVYLPPCVYPRTGKWAAFIHPGMGASFADEAGLDMAPPLAGQIAFLEGLDSIGEVQFLAALKKLQAPKQSPSAPLDAAPERRPQDAAANEAAPPGAGPAQQRTAPEGGLLLKDATLEDIVAFLHAKKIEPTFRFLAGPHP